MIKDTKELCKLQIDADSGTVINRSINMNILTLGSGEAFDSRLGNHSYLFYNPGFPTILFDCGYQVPERLWKEKKHYQNLAAVVISHAHADHYFGIAPLCMRMLEEDRRQELLIIGPKGLKRKVEKLCQLAYGNFLARAKFKLVFKEMVSGESFEWRKVNFSCAKTIHSVTNLLMRVEFKGLKQSFAISGDGKLSPKAIKLIRGVNLLIQEVFSLDKELPNHTSLKELLALLESTELSEIKMVGISHVSRENRVLVEKFVHQKLKDSKFMVLQPGDVITW